jgi:predicted nucleic acid-binding protein
VAFVDASALVALADEDDASHEAAVLAYRDLVASGFRLFTSDLALVSAHDLLAVALGPDVARQWLARCRITIYSVDADDLATGRQMISDAGSQIAALHNAVHLAVLDRLGVTDVFAVDRAFLAALG